MKLTVGSDLPTELELEISQHIRCGMGNNLKFVEFLSRLEARKDRTLAFLSVFHYRFAGYAESIDMPALARSALQATLPEALHLQYGVHWNPLRLKEDELVNGRIHFPTISFAEYAKGGGNPRLDWTQDSSEKEWREWDPLSLGQAASTSLKICEDGGIHWGAQFLDSAVLRDFDEERNRQVSVF